MRPEKITIVIPAYNEAAWLPGTLGSIAASAEDLRRHSGVQVEVIVVDNNSSDATGDVARERGAQVIHEPVQGIARARNAGARQAAGDVLVFVDADVIVPPTLLRAIQSALSDPDCVGGGVDVEYRPLRLAVRWYLGAWRLLGRLLGMVQGATQFCRRDVFDRVGGFDEGAWIGEDVDFYWAMKRHARQARRAVRLIREPRVRPSCRRFDQWPLWKTLVWTNPVFIAAPSPVQVGMGRLVLPAGQVGRRPRFPGNRPVTAPAPGCAPPARLGTGTSRLPPLGGRPAIRRAGGRCW